MSVRDASHDWDRSRVWDLAGESGMHHYLKVSPSVTFFTRESRAYRHLVPALGHSRAPHLVLYPEGEGHERPSRMFAAQAAQYGIMPAPTALPGPEAPSHPAPRRRADPPA
ncbi:hypothetical protein [Streptomyces sp. NPDC058861]|uniref:hypothetical protein n=1 Tax=Streptomyces sp. NPDC058861 TaxID=3346653 RepID=UPI00369DFFEE